MDLALSSLQVSRHPLSQFFRQSLAASAPEQPMQAFGLIGGLNRRVSRHGAREEVLHPFVVFPGKGNVAVAANPSRVVIRFVKTV